jgi:hypothetical protein
LSFRVDYWSLNQPVEQQSPNYFQNNCGQFPFNPACNPSLWVTNPTGCLWAVDDAGSQTGFGNLAGNSSVSSSICMISDLDNYTNFGGEPKRVSVFVRAATSNLVVSVSNDLGVSYQVAPVNVGPNEWEYLSCGFDATHDPYSSVAGSNGGIGTPVVYTLTVANPTAKQAKNTRVTLQLGWGIYSMCGPPGT